MTFLTHTIAFRPLFLLRAAILLFVLVVVPLGVTVAHAQMESASDSVIENQEQYEPVLYIFHSLTCPHCRKEMAFLDRMEERYPSLDIQRYEINDKANQPLLRAMAKKYAAERYLGQVPMTFIGPEYFVGYDSDEGTGAKIESAIKAVLAQQPNAQMPVDPEEVPAQSESAHASEGADTDGEGTGAEAPMSTAVPLAQSDDETQANAANEPTMYVPILGAVDPSAYSLSILAILLGFLDGFNVCSLGALVLIIGLTLKLQRRRAIVLFGGAFVLTTALVYGALIVLWYKLFEYLNAYLNILTFAVALLSLGGGLYFLREYLRMRTQGAVCTFSESPWIQKVTEHTGRAFEHPGRLLTVFSAVVVFAGVVALIEFPCSASVPVIFAGILADAGLSTLGYLAHIGLFVLFYMLDELLVFGIAAYRLKVWMTSGTFTKWAVLGEAVILIGIGVFYLGTITGVI